MRAARFCSRLPLGAGSDKNEIQPIHHAAAAGSTPNSEIALGQRGRFECTLQASFPGAGAGVTSAGASIGAAAAAVEEQEDEEEVKDVMEDSDEDMDLFGEMTEEEKKADAERKAAIAAKLAKSKAKAAKAKSMIIIDVKPWDDETVMECECANVTDIATTFPFFVFAALQH
ncbi:hypothetical protein BSKO_07357 [Bryopsis sp. KO-2023]|nr:hypothetical protein BSKO_07357 [Bryopsis sp. KO-2023]